MANGQLPGGSLRHALDALLNPISLIVTVEGAQTFDRLMVTSFVRELEYQVTVNHTVGDIVSLNDGLTANYDGLADLITDMGLGQFREVDGAGAVVKAGNGLLSVRATWRQQDEIDRFLNELREKSGPSTRDALEARPSPAGSRQERWRFNGFSRSQSALVSFLRSRKTNERAATESACNSDSIPALRLVQSSWLDSGA